MTQARSGQTLLLNLVPMQLPEAVPTPTAVSETLGPQITTRSSLLVHPGEPSEILVQIENLSNRALQLDLQVQGNFALEWCRIGGVEGRELAPGQRMEAVLYFQIPPDFFESQTALQPGKTLTLDYKGQLYATYTERETGREQIESAPFNLLIRPHSLYLNFLPKIYGEVDFMGRFLKVFEQTFEPVVQTLESLWAYFDPLTAPRALLPFLAYWVAWPMDPRWGVEKQRRLIRSAMELYRWRGTRYGLRLYLHLYTDLPLDEDLPESQKHISIEERFGEDFILGTTALGDDCIIGGSCPFHFTVRLRPDRSDQLDESLVRTIIEQEKPAFCSYDLYIEPRTA